jgi:hypothetical protein
MRCSSQTVLITLALGLASASMASAQTKIALTPSVGIYAPTQDLVNAVISGEEVQLKQDVGVALGGRLSLLFGQRITLAATGSYVPSELQATIDQSGVAVNEGKTNLFFGSARLTAWLIPPTAPVSFGLGGGLGIVNRGETRLVTPGGEPLTSPGETDIGGLVTGIIGINIGGLGLFVSVDNYIYQPSVFSELGVANPTQNDIHFNLGLGIPLGGR